MQTYTQDIARDDFFRLLQISVGSRETLEQPLSDSRWKALYGLSRRQSVLGMAYRAVMMVPEELQPPKKIRVMLAYAADGIERSNASLTAEAGQLTSWLSEMGMESCVLKGQGTALLYPEPALRQCGDIDIWVKGRRSDILRAIRARWKTGDVFYHHTSIRPFGNGTEVEVHFTPSWMNDPFTNRKLQRYFSSMEKRQFGNYQENVGFSIPEPGFNCVYGAVHIYRHLLQEGIGVRQIMDYLYVLTSASKEDRDAALEVIKSLKMRKFAGALMSVLQTLFLVEDEYLLCRPDARLGAFLLDEIMFAGNFGRYDTRYSYSDSDGLLKRASGKMRRLSHFFCIAPAEVLWAPAFKTWQHLWRWQFR